jgi:hypothetical protein
MSISQFQTLTTSPSYSIIVSYIYGRRASLNSIRHGQSVSNLSLSPVCSILPTAAALPNSLSIYVHTEWLRRAIANPCLLHSTLFCASAYLDSRQNANSPSSRTMFHHLQAVKIIREQLAQPNFQPSYEIAAAVLALSYFTVGWPRFVCRKQHLLIHCTR